MKPFQTGPTGKKAPSPGPPQTPAAALQVPLSTAPKIAPGKLSLQVVTVISTK